MCPPGSLGAQQRGSLSGGLCPPSGGRQSRWLGSLQVGTISLPGSAAASVKRSLGWVGRSGSGTCSEPLSIQEVMQRQPVAVHIQSPCRQPHLPDPPWPAFRHMPSPPVCRHWDPDTSQVYYMTLKQDGTSSAVPYPASHGQVRVHGNMSACEASLAWLHCWSQGSSPCR